MFLLLSAGLFGCADEEMLRPCAMPERLPPAPAVADSFPVYTVPANDSAREETNPPRPRLQHSLSLGFVGNEPLAGGVMRDTPMMPPQQYDGQDPAAVQGQTWQQYVRNPSWPQSYPQMGPRYICDCYRCYPLPDR